MTTLDRLPILERRRIQAEIVKPIWEAMVAEQGRDKAREIIGRAVIDAAVEEGRRFAEAHGGPGGLDGFRSFQHLWDADGALETEVVEETATDHVYKVTRCRYAEMYREMGLGEIGHLLSCQRDGSFCEGYDPKLRMKRSQTIMGGASHCDFRYTYEDDGEAAAVPGRREG